MLLVTSTYFLRVVFQKCCYYVEASSVELESEGPQLFPGTVHNLIDVLYVQG